MDRADSTDSVTEYANKSIELKILKNALNASRDQLSRRRNILNEMRIELDGINNRLLMERDKFCDTVWRFSAENNFQALFDLRETVVAGVQNAEDWSNVVIDEKAERQTDLDAKEETIKKLERDIKMYDDEINILRNSNKRKELSDASVALENLKSFSEKLSATVKLIGKEPLANNAKGTLGANNARSFNSSRNIEKTKKPSGKDENSGSEFISAKKLCKGVNAGPQILCRRKIRRRIIIADRATETNSQQGQPGKQKRCGQFILKNRSHISLKLEQNRILSEHF